MKNIITKLGLDFVSKNRRYHSLYYHYSQECKFHSKRNYFWQNGKVHNGYFQKNKNSYFFNSKRII